MLKIVDYEVSTRSGFENFRGVRKVQRMGRIEILLDDGETLKCTDNHRLMTRDGWKFAHDIRSSDHILKKTGFVKVFDSQYVDGEYTFYDLVDVDNGNEYFTNDIVSHNCEFLGSSSTLIDGIKLRNLTYSTPLKTTEHVSLYTEPAQGRSYIIVADTSRGIGEDYCAFVVFDVSEFPYKVVAKYRNNKISTLLYPNFIYQFAKLYNNAYVLVESNDVGKQVADIMYYDLEYEYMFFTANDPKTGQHISAGFKGNAVLGVKTSRSVKRIGCSNFKTMVENDKFEVNDYDLLQEMYRFSAKGDSYEAEEGHDDLVMCSVLFSWLIQQPYVKELTSTDIRSVSYTHLTLPTKLL
jgi:intein/homing endonuclease